MGFEAWYTISVIIFIIAALASNRIGPDTVMLGGITLLLVVGILDPKSAAAGFADPSVLMIAALFVIATGLSQTGAMTMITSHVLGKPQTLSGAQFRMMVPVAAMSAVMNNTPIVAMYMPVVHDWARKLRISPSKLFIPLSFASIFGGACTLIGTSSNLAVNQLYLEYFQSNAQMLHDAFGIVEPSSARQFWAVAIVGLPCAIIGIPMVVYLSRWFLPVRVAPDQDFTQARQYAVEMLVEKASPIVDKTIEQADLRQLPGLYLVEIQRGDEVLPAVSPDVTLQAGDCLVFVGIVDSVVDLLKIRGLVPATTQASKIAANRGQRRIVEAVVSHGSPLVRQTVRQSQFRTRYNAAIIAVHRAGHRINKKIGDIVLKPGDTLLLMTHSGFVPAHRNSKDFYLVSTVDNAREVHYERAWVAIGIMALLVILLTMPLGLIVSKINQITGLSLPQRNMPPLAVGFLCASLMVYTRCCTGTAARNAINWQVLLVIGAALGIGRAMRDTGAAQGIADAFLSVTGSLNPYTQLFVFSIMVNIFCQLVTNKGAAVLMFPIAIAIAHNQHLNPEPFVITLMATAACSFMTPIGFPTNLMVYGPGGYRFSDYLRMGIPLTLLVAIISTIATPLAFPFVPTP